MAIEQDVQLKKEMQEIFEENILLQNNINEMISFYRCQDYYSGNIKLNITLKRFNRSVSWMLQHMNALAQEIGYLSEDYIIGLLELIMETQKNEDYVLLGDLFEKEVLTLVEEVQRFIMLNGNLTYRNYLEENLCACHNAMLVEDLKKMKQESEAASPIVVEQTNCGLLTCSYEENGKRKYLHSNVNPVKEAELFAQSCEQKATYEYVIYGFGFAYHILELLNKDKRIRIKVVESNIDILFAAFQNIDLQSLLTNERFLLCYVKDAAELNREIKEGGEFIVHYPSVMAVKDKNLKDALEDYFINYSSIKAQKKMLDTNFYFNALENVCYVDELEEEFHSKTMILVAAGPSLDDDLKELKRIQDSHNSNVFIVSVGTVAKKLIQKAIIPDYIVISDAKEFIKHQVNGIEEKDTKLLYLSTASNEAVKCFNGNKYMICQKGYEGAELLASDNHLHLFETGGSVATVAIDIGIRFQCKQIICVGLDLAFTKEKGHAFDNGKLDISNENLRKVQGVNNEMVYTKKNLDIYRKWIENRIADEKIEIINTSKGAKIEGMRNCKLSELIL